MGASSSPFAAQQTRKVIERDLARTRTVCGGTMRERPNLYDHVTQGVSVVAINLATEKAQTICENSGLGSLPCANPKCFGANGRWCTTPVGWQHQLSAPSVFVDENGRAGAMDIARSHCHTCQNPFYHTDPVVLGRLEEVPDLLNELPFDPQYQFCDIYLHRSHTSSLEYDSITRQGVSNAVQKIKKLAAQSCLRRAKQYYNGGQLWWQQLVATVGEQAWQVLTPDEQLTLAELRGEYLYFDGCDKLTRLAAFDSTEHFGSVMLSDTILSKRLLEVYEERRDVRTRQMCAVGCQIAAQIDWCAHTGKVLGGKWNALCCNEDSDLVGSKVTQTTTLKEIADWLRTLKKRSNFNPLVAIIDNVPPQLLDAHGRMPTDIIDLIVECFELKSREYVLQDKFHVSHGFSPFFCNQDARFWDLVIKDWRHAISYRDDEAFETVKSALRAGKVKKSCKFRGESVSIKLGEQWDDTKIAAAVASGLFDEMFTLCDKPVVPLHIKSAKSLRDDVPAWVESIVDAAFAPAGDDGVRAPIKCNGKTLIASETKLRQLGENALKRVLNCVPPDDVRHLAWTKTGEQDHNGFDVFSSNFHSCSAESWNSTQPDFLVGANVTKEKATAHHFEGNVRQLVRKQVKLGRQEDLGTYNPMDAWEANRLAGHDAAQSMPRLLAHRPYAVDRPPPVGAEEVCVQAIGSFAKGSDGGKRPELSELDRLLLPRMHPTVGEAKAQQQQLNFSTAAAITAASPPAAANPAPITTRTTTAPVIAAPAPVATSASVAVSAITQAAAALTQAVTTIAAHPQPSSSHPRQPAVIAHVPASQAPPPPYHPSLPSYHPPPPFSAPPPPQKRAKTRAESHSRACKWRCMCKSDAQLAEREGKRGGRALCVAECPRRKWACDPGWPQAPTIPDEPALGVRCSYLPPSGKEGAVEYHGRGEWRPVPVLEPTPDESR